MNNTSDASPKFHEEFFLLKPLRKLENNACRAKLDSFDEHYECVAIITREQTLQRKEGSMVEGENRADRWIISQ